MEFITVPVCPMRTDHPYTAMLHDYEAAAEALRARITELNTALHTLLCPAQRLLLEKRIQTLREEYYEIRLDIREIKSYAEREAT